MKAAILSTLASAVAAMTAMTAPAQAICLQGIGCTHTMYLDRMDLVPLTCEQLWVLRNSIYKENGYCFRTPRGIARFGNAGCQFDNVAEVPLNNFERQNVDAIRFGENFNACPR